VVVLLQDGHELEDCVLARRTSWVVVAIQ
jgi:hypothetical protein